MSTEAEFKGKTVAQAVEKACQHLDIVPKNIKYDVVSRGATGIFGIVGARKAHIRVYLEDYQQEDACVSNDHEAGAEAQKPKRALSEPALFGQGALEKIANGITGGASVLAAEDKKGIFYRIEGGRAGVLIGKRGQTLEAIQYLVEKMVNRKSKNRMRVRIDVGGYLEKKRKTLESLAQRTAEKAKQNRKPATVGKLNAHDRRIIHMALKNDEDVITKSVGNGFLLSLIHI